MQNRSAMGDFCPINHSMKNTFPCLTLLITVTWKRMKEEVPWFPPCLALCYRILLQSWRLMVIQWNSPFLVSPPVFATSQSQMFIIVLFYSAHSLLVLGRDFLRVCMLDSPCCEIQRRKPRWLSTANCDSHELFLFEKHMIKLENYMTQDAKKCDFN